MISVAHAGQHGSKDPAGYKVCVVVPPQKRGGWAKRCAAVESVLNHPMSRDGGEVGDAMVGPRTISSSIMVSRPRIWGRRRDGHAQKQPKIRHI